MNIYLSILMLFNIIVLEIDICIYNDFFFTNIDENLHNNNGLWLGPTGQSFPQMWMWKPIVV